MTPLKTTQNNSPPVLDLPSFNLWTEAWLPLEMLDGSLQRHSIRDALLRAHQCRGIYDPSPLVIVGAHRLLTAILQDAVNPQGDSDLEALWRHGEGIPNNTIAAFGQQFEDRFDLFSPDRPFLQSADLPMRPRSKEEQKERSSIAKLFIDIPTGTGIAHYRHSQEDEVVFSPATAALGLVAMPPFVSSGGPGLMPSINGVPPIYVLPGGETLFEQLVSSLLASGNGQMPIAGKTGDLAWWRRPIPVQVATSKKKTPAMSLADSKQQNVVGYLHGMTFPARKIRLHPELLNMICSRSGEPTAWAVRTMAFRMGESLLEEAPVWRDPFVAYRLPELPKAGKTGKSKVKAKVEKPKPIRPAVNKGRAAWREFSALFMRHSKAQTTERPRFLDQLSSLAISDRRPVHPMRCIGLQTDGKMKFFEWLDFGFDVPPNLLRDPDGAYWTDEALAFATECAATITRVFSNAFGRKAKNAERFRGLKANMEADLWNGLGVHFRAFVITLGDASGRDVSLDAWLDSTKREAQHAFDLAADATGDDGNALHLIEQGKAQCRIALANLRDRKDQTVDSEGAIDVTVKPKRTKRARR